MLNCISKVSLVKQPCPPPPIAIASRPFGSHWPGFKSRAGRRRQHLLEGERIPVGKGIRQVAGPRFGGGYVPAGALGGYREQYDGRPRELRGVPDAFRHSLAAVCGDNHACRVAAPRCRPRPFGCGHRLVRQSRRAGIDPLTVRGIAMGLDFIYSSGVDTGQANRRRTAG